MIDSAGTEWSRVPGSTERGLNKDGSTKSQGHHASHFPTEDLPESTQNGKGSSIVEQN